MKHVSLLCACWLASCDAPSRGRTAPPPDASSDATPAAAGAPPTGACRNEWCWVMPLPQGNALKAIWGVAADDVWSMGDFATMVHYDGSSWTELPLPFVSLGTNTAITDPLGEIWGTSSSDVWAAGAMGILHWDGNSWSSSKAETAYVIGGTGPDDVWSEPYRADGSSTLHWDGSAWQSEPGTIANQHSLAFGGSPGAAVDVLENGGIARWSGTVWDVVDGGSHPANAAVVLGANDVIVAQDGGAISLWNGSTWSTQTAPIAAKWGSIAATADDDVWVNGFAPNNQQTVTYHWDGSTWMDASMPGDRGTVAANGLWLDPSDKLWAAMDNASVQTLNGSTWVAMTTGDNFVDMVGGTADDDIWIAGFAFGNGGGIGRDRITHWNGTAWIETPFPFDAQMTSLWSAAPNDVWLAAGQAASDNGTNRLLFRWNGKAWSLFGTFGEENTIPDAAGFTRVWGSSATDVYAVAPTAVFHFDGTSWSPIAALSGGTDVFGTSATDVHVVSSSALSSWDGSAWTSLAVSGMLRGWENAPDDIWLTPDQTSLTAYHFDGVGFSPFTTGVGREIALGNASEMFTFTYNLGESMISWPGGFATTMKTSTPAAFVFRGNGWTSPSGHIYAATGPGLLVH